MPRQYILSIRPQWMRLILDGKKVVEVRLSRPKGQQDALERASLLSKVGQGNCVKFEIKEKNLCITSNSELGNVKENVPVNTSGKDLLIAFNARYFIESLRANQDEFVKICFNSPANPCVIVPIEGDEFLYLILPVRMIG